MPDNIYTFDESGLPISFSYGGKIRAVDWAGKHREENRQAQTHGSHRTGTYGRTEANLREPRNC